MRGRIDPEDLNEALMVMSSLARSCLKNHSRRGGDYE